MLRLKNTWFRILLSIALNEVWLTPEVEIAARYCFGFDSLGLRITWARGRVAASAALLSWRLIVLFRQLKLKIKMVNVIFVY